MMLTTVKVYTRHNRNCPKRDRSDCARCNCMKWLCIYRDGKYKLVSARTRSWEKAGQKASELRDSFDPVKQLQGQLEAKAQKRDIKECAALERLRKYVARIGFWPLGDTGIYVMSMSQRTCKNRGQSRIH